MVLNEKGAEKGQGKGKIIYIGYMILFSNVIVFAGATLGGFLLTTHVPVGGALIAVLFLMV